MGGIVQLNVVEKTILVEVLRDYDKTMDPYTAVLGEDPDSPVPGGR